MDARGFLEQLKGCIDLHLTFPSFVVKTPALQDNLLAAIVALSSRLPLMCLGCDGTSKTLSINLLLSQMHGPFSKSKLLQCLSKAQTFNLQLSEQSTAEHIVKLKKTVISWESKVSIPVVFIEEMSMADMGPRGPTRAFHDLLDSHQEGQRCECAENMGTGSNTFGFLSTSNYGPRPYELPVGRALGNRLLILAHEPLPAQSLIELGVSVGMHCVSCDDAIHRQHTETTLHSVLKSLWGTSNSRANEPLVPNLVSIRSFLFFSRSLAMALSNPKCLLFDAQVRAFGAHLQRVTRDKSEALWRRIGTAFGWNLETTLRPTVEGIAKDSFGSLRTRRPLLFVYQNPGDIFNVVSLTTRLYKKSAESVLDYTVDAAIEIKKICPSVRSIAFLKDERSRLIDGAESLHALIQLRSAVEKGGLITILNPEPIIEGIHALLNDSAAEHSTLQLRQSHENVRIHRASQLVLLVERSSALSLHKALLSRVAIVNSGIFRWDDADAIEDTRPRPVGAHARLLDFYSTIPSHLTETWSFEESALLKLCEDALDELIENLLTTAFHTRGSGIVGGAGHSADKNLARLIITLIRGRIPVTIYQDKRIYFIDSIQYDTPALFFTAVFEAVKKLEVPGPVNSPMLLIDLTTATTVALVECLTLLGLAGIRFSTAACSDSLGDRLMKLAARTDRRIVIAVDVLRASCCSPAHYRAWTWNKRN